MGWASFSVFFLAAACLAGLSQVHAATYTVTNSIANDVNWNNLQPGDVVKIQYREQPYREKWVLNVAGTANNPIVVSGVLGPNGEKPIIDGNGATTPTYQDYWNENRGLIKIGEASTPSVDNPKHIIIENLELRNAYQDYTFTDDNGNSGISYSKNAACIYIATGEQVTIRNCEIHSCGNGIFIGFNSEGKTRDILIEKNYIHGNGVVGSILEHNSYCEARGITYQYNRYGPLRSSALGNNLKDRSGGTIIRYNWIEGGNRQLDLVESDYQQLVSDPIYRKTFVYGNILIEFNGEGNKQMIHYGGDDPTTSNNYRKGKLYSYHNTFVSTRTDSTTLMRLSTNDEKCDSRNDIIYAPDGTLSILAESGVIDIRGSWISDQWVESFEGSNFQGTVNTYSIVEGSEPGFKDPSSQNFQLTKKSVCRGVSVLLHSNALSIKKQYQKHFKSNNRYTTNDLGAFEFPAPKKVKNLQHTDITRTSAISKWKKPSSGADCYQIQTRKQKSSGTWASWENVKSCLSKSKKKLKKLSKSTMYQTRVRAKIQGKKGKWALAGFTTK